MVKIGLISDTHSYLDETVFDHFKSVDEIWHGGDFGSLELIERLQKFKPLKGVFGNIDGPEIRNVFPEQLIFEIEQVKIFIQHIGGYPGKYEKGVKEIIKKEKPELFISGHSHILKVMYDDALSCLHMNPGAAGKTGWHTMRTLLRFDIDGKEFKNLEVIELGPR